MLEKSDLTLANWDELRLEILQLMKKRGIKSIRLVSSVPYAQRLSVNNWKYRNKNAEPEEKDRMAKLLSGSLYGKNTTR
mgnify:CR=1 FL=1